MLLPITFFLLGFSGTTVMHGIVE
uniref:Uncharacterized protein n=1 Tax=Rhizophora mucronata TaxID=61149 RepID=A0A2P2QPQ4_RHIMU